MTMTSGGNVPTPEHEREEAMPSDLGERKEVIPQEPESDFSEEFEECHLPSKISKRVSPPCSCKEYELKTLMSKAQMTTFLMTTLV